MPFQRNTEQGSDVLIQNGSPMMRSSPRRFVVKTQANSKCHSPLHRSTNVLAENCGFNVDLRRLTRINTKDELL